MPLNERAKGRRHSGGTPETPENFHKKAEHTTPRRTSVDRESIVDPRNAPGMERTLDRSQNLDRSQPTDHDASLGRDEADDDRI